jgi:threonine/homoserine/homoserine lactone efflux protein
LIQPIWQGIVLGLLLSVLIGPVFFVLIETSLRRGVRSALFIDLGVLISDVSFIVLAIIFTSQITALREEEGLMQIIGGALFLVFGGAVLFKKQKLPVNRQEKFRVQTTRNNLKDMLKGFSLNTLTPSVMFFWLTTVGIAQDNFGSHQTYVIVFFVSLLITLFSFDVLKILGASYLKRFITPRFLLHLNKVVGICLIIFGGIFIWKGLAA